MLKPLRNFVVSPGLLKGLVWSQLMLVKVVAMSDVMNAQYPFKPLAGTFPNRFEPHANLVNNTVSIYNGTNKFELLTDEQAFGRTI